MADLTGKSILIVEDEALLALLLKDAVEEAGAIAIGPATTIATALPLIEAGGIDGAVLDLNLGGDRSGPIAEALGAARIPFVVATGYGAATDIGQGAAAVVHKPYDPETVLNALAGAVGGV